MVVKIVLALPAGQQAVGFALPARLLTALAAAVAVALTNAFRHGAARAAWFEVSLDGAGLVVQVADDGMLAEPAGAGMGSRLYDESSHEWSRRRGADDLTHLRAVVPLVTLPVAHARGVAAP